MKKPLLILFTCLAFHLALQGQRAMNLDAKFNLPKTGSYIPSQETFIFSVTIHNLDTGTIRNEDTLNLYLLMQGDSMFFVNNGKLNNHIKLFNNTLKQGDSLIFSNKFAFDKSLDDMALDLCVYVKPVNYAKPITDTDQSDNQSCITVTVKEDNSNIQVIGTKSDPVRIYPNPAKDHFNIRSKETIRSIIVTDLEGRRTDLMIPVSGTVDCSSLASGIYVVSVTTDSGIHTMKLTVQN